MPKSRDIQEKMPSPKVILNAFLLVTVKVLNSYLQLMKNRTAMICVMEEKKDITMEETQRPCKRVVDSQTEQDVSDAPQLSELLWKSVRRTADGLD